MGPNSKRLYGREEKAQKSRSSRPPCFIHGGARGIPATDLSNQYLRAMPLLPCVDPNMPLPSSPVLPAMAEHVKRLVLLASTKPRRHVLMVFLGGAVTALGLLQELHTRNALVRIHIYQSGDTKDGPGARVSCCPFCAYTIQNDPAYLNHIVCAHYDASFGCGSCLSAVTSSVQKMKDHIKECPGLTTLITPSQESVPGGRSPKKGVPDSKHVSKKKKSSRSEKSQPAGQASQDSQASDRRITRANRREPGGSSRVYQAPHSA